MHTQGNSDDVRPDDQATSSPITTLGSARSSLTIPEPPFAHVQPACFQTLPPELQQKIWKEAVADPMIYQLQIHKYFMTSIDLFCVTYFEEEISLSASVRQTCYQSREVAMYFQFQICKHHSGPEPLVQNKGPFQVSFSEFRRNVLKKLAFDVALLDRRDGKELLMLRDFIWVHNLEETILVARLSPNILTSTQDRLHFIELSQGEERVYIDNPSNLGWHPGSDENTSSQVTAVEGVPGPGHAPHSADIPTRVGYQLQPTGFKLLAYELRQNIWNEVLKEPVVFQLQVHLHDIFFGNANCLAAHGECLITYSEEDFNLKAAILHTCFESRDIASKVMNPALIFQNKPNAKNTGVNYSTSTTTTTTKDRPVYRDISEEWNFMRGILWALNPEKLIFIDRWPSGVPCYAEGELQFVELHFSELAICGDRMSKFPNFRLSCERRSSFKMPEAEIIGLTKGGVRL
ncbi:hypothetical protein B0J14DRAFT_673677 [Halenospora varia]|nr:hypothetical protein B0J14DRAFT_673677 [Halenospora varia]